MSADDKHLLRALQNIREEFSRTAKRQEAEYEHQRHGGCLGQFRRRRGINDEPYRPATYQSEQDQKQKLDADMVLWTRAVARYTKALVIVGAVGAVIAGGTLWAIKGQLNEMRSTGTQTDELIAANKQSADAAAKNAEAATASAAVLQHQLKVMQGQLDAMNRDQQPYVSYADSVWRPQMRVVDGVPRLIHWRFDISNTGKGTARDLTIRTFMAFENGPFKPSKSWARREPIIMDELGAGKGGGFEIFADTTVSADEFNRLTAENFGISALMEFSYSDVIGTRHENATCVSYYAQGAIAKLDVAECKKRKAGEAGDQSQAK